MSIFIASKFDPENDPDKPKENTIISVENKEYVIKKVDHIFLSDIIKGEEKSNGEYDILLTKMHSQRPAVVWLLWCNKIK